MFDSARNRVEERVDVSRGITHGDHEHITLQLDVEYPVDSLLETRSQGESDVLEPLTVGAQQALGQRQTIVRSMRLSPEEGDRSLTPGATCRLSSA